MQRNKIWAVIAFSGQSMFRLGSLLVLISLLSISNSASADIVFTLDDGDALFDGGNAGDSGTFVDPADAACSVDVMIVDVLAPEYEEDPNNPGVWIPTGIVLSSLAGDNVSTNISGNDALAVANPSIGNTNFQNSFGPSGENTNMNFEEALIIEFSEDVVFTDLDFNSMDDGDQFEVDIPGLGTFPFGNTNANDIFPDPFGAGVVITAGTQLTFEVVGTDESDIIRINDFTIEVVNKAVPEPSSLALIGLLGMGVATRRRR